MSKLRFRLTCIVLLAMFVGYSLRSAFQTPLLMASSSASPETHEKLICRELVLQDKNGRKRIEFSATAGGGLIRFFDRKMKKRIELGLEEILDERGKEKQPARAYLSMFNGKEEREVRLQAAGIGTGKITGGSLHLEGNESISDVILGIFPSGECHLELSNSKKADGVTIRAGPTLGTQIIILNPDGETIFNLSTPFNGKDPKLELKDGRGAHLWKVP